MAGSRWARIDLGYLDNPKIRSLGSAADVAVHLGSILYSGSHLTDGLIPDQIALRLIDDAFVTRQRYAQRFERLVTAGLWIRVEGGWRIHDFEEMNPQLMRENVEHQRKLWRARQARLREGCHGVTEEDVTG